MEPKKFTLRPACTACPGVEIRLATQGITIDDEANTVRLSHAERNELVRPIKGGELHEL